jgi:hypothetical protein
MRNAHVTLTVAQDLLRSSTEDREVILLVRKMARELVRLDEENAQLLAAIEVYRELVRRYSLRAGQGNAPIQ